MNTHSFGKIGKNKKAFALSAFFVAASALAVAAETTTYDVGDEAALRKYLSEKYSWTEPGENGESIVKESYYDNSELKITADIFVETTKIETSATTANNGISVNATNIKILGNGKTISSSEIELSVAGSGDLFFLNGVALSVENLKLAGTTDEAKKTGRAFATGNSISSRLTLGAGTTIENRRLVADASANYRALGSALVSAHIADEVKLTSAAGANIAFRGNTAVGREITTSSGTEKLSASGGAIYASGLLSISGAGTTLFTKNSAVSEVAAASGGAIFISSAKLNADGSSSSTKYPDNVVDETGTKKIGLQVAGTTLKFSENFARGLNANGGAVVVSGGYFDATASTTIAFSKNYVENLYNASATAATQLGGGALLVCDGGRATFAEGITVDFSGNGARANSALSVASGGALVVSDAAVSFAGTTTFSDNSVSSVAAGTGTVAFAGTTLQGGAAYVYGTKKSTTADDGTTTKTHTTSVTLAGTMRFEYNSILSYGFAYTPSEGGEKTQSSATGGALLLNGGKIDGSGLKSLTFSRNNVSAGSTAQGGALASISDVTEATFADANFLNNFVKLFSLVTGESQSDGVVPVARGGALYVAGGSLTFSGTSGGKINSNTANADSQANALAQGGAIFQNAGTLTFGTAEKIFKFSENSASSLAGTAQGGAAYFSGTAETTFSGILSTFSKNTATAMIAQGGAIYADGGKQSFECILTFSNNDANALTTPSTTGTPFARGGAIFLASAAEQEFSGRATINDNRAVAVDADGNSGGGQRSGAAGGAIFSAGTLSFTNEKGCQISGNDAVVSGDENGAAFGGAIYVAGGGVSAKKIKMESNSAHASGDAFGGAIYVASAGTFAIDGGISFLQNNVGNSFSEGSVNVDSAKRAQGGAIYSAGTVNIIGDFSAVQNTATAKNTAQGGAIFIENSSFTQSAGTATFSYNEATATASGGTAQGGAIYLRGGNAAFAGATFSRNYATASDGTAQGGAIYIDVSKSAGATLTLSGNTTISGNTANGAADGIFVGTGTATAAKSAATVIFEQRATLVRDDDGNVSSRKDVETATISDPITAAAGTTLVLKKTGSGDLSLGDIVANGDAKISLEIADGEASTTTLAGNVSALNSLSVGSGATLEISLKFGGCASATLAGTVNVASGAEFAFANGSATTLTGTLAFSDGAKATISGASAISGAGTFSVVGATTFKFSSAGEGESAVAGSLSAANLGLGAGTLTLDGAGTLNVSDTLTFTGGAEIALGADATLGLVKVKCAADGTTLKLSGAGTLVLYGESSSASGKITLEDFKNDAGTALSGTLSIANAVNIKTGFSVGSGMTLSINPDSNKWMSGSRNILLKGGTLLAPGTSEAAPLALESLSVSGTSVLGAAGESQHFKIVSASSSGEPGAVLSNSVAGEIPVSGTLEVTETSVLTGNVAFGAGGKLGGAGTLVGNIVSGTGTVSIAKVDGNVTVERGRGITFDGAVAVTGDVTVGESVNSLATFASGANLSVGGTFSNGGKTTASTGATFTGTFVNTGTLAVGENATFVFGSGSSFTNTTTGTLDISAANSAVDFSNAGRIVIEGGRVLIDATKLQKGGALGILGIENESLLANLTIEDVNNYSVASRFVWDADTGTLIFRGLNGEAFRGTIYGDFQRESVNRTHELLRTAQLRAGTRMLTPRVYGENKLHSSYMRGYLEKQAQRGGEVSAELEAQRKHNAELAQKLNSRLFNAWAQGDFSFREQRGRHGAVAYDSNIAQVLAGVSVPVGAWEFGLVAASGTEKYKTKNAATHQKIETTPFALSGYAVAKGKVFDWTFGFAGAYAASKSERGDYSGDFNTWRIGANTEFGATLRANSSFALRVFAGISAAYSDFGAFDESGTGENALSFKSDSAVGLRSDLGISAAYLVTDTLQFSVRAVWLADFGNGTYSLDARMPGTDTDYVFESRKNETSALEAGAYMHWTFADSMEFFGGYTGTLRAGERTHALSLGVNYFF